MAARAENDRCGNSGTLPGLSRPIVAVREVGLDVSHRGNQGCSTGVRADGGEAKPCVAPSLWTWAQDSWSAPVIGSEA